MNVWKSIESALKKGKVHMTLLDPDKLSPETIAEICASAAAAGTDAIMLGGSTGITVENLDKSISAIKERTRLPVILFPMGARSLSGRADAIYFMSLMNSRNLRFVIGEQVMGAPVVKALGLEPISMGYIIIEPGMKVGEVGEADAVPRSEPKTAVAYALAAQYLGKSLVYLEAGSGAHSPVPDEMVSAVKRAVAIPLVVGGGVRTAQQARALAAAGADVLVTGTLAEESTEGADLAGVIKAFKGK
ncbi:MAG: geranylgeranylglyceryl/heptaprenylglyceryl phosphate synthase [Methanobacteriota archaeon]